MFGSSFGNTATAGNSGAAGVMGSGGLFGSNTNSNTNTNNTSAGTLFGANTSNSAPLFGGNANNAASGGLFGKPATPSIQTTAPTATGSSLFGGSNNATASNTAAAPSGGLFGSKPAASSGLFGGNTSGGGGLFGASAQTPAPATGSSGLFGSKPAATNSGTGGLFGGGGAANSTGGLFGGGGAANSTGGLFGGGGAANSTGGLFGASSSNTGNTGTGNLNNNFAGSNAGFPNISNGLGGNNANNLINSNGLAAPLAMTRIGNLPPQVKAELEQFDKYINTQHLIATTLQADYAKHGALIESIPKDINYLRNKLLSTRQALKFDQSQLAQLKQLNGELTEDITKIMQLITELSTPGTRLSSSYHLNDFFIKKIKKYYEILGNYESLVTELEGILNGLEKSCNEGFGNLFNIVQVIRSQYNLFMELCDIMAQLHSQVNKLK